MSDSRSSSGRLYVLDLSGGRIFSLNPDGSDSKTLVTGCRLPDGLAVDSAAGYIYWTNMGVPHRNDGSIERADLDGGNRRFIIPEGGTFTPKQLHLEKKSGKHYWSDREGMRVMRANLDGSQVEILFEGLPEPIDLELDLEHRVLYWTDRGDPPRGNTVSRTPIDGQLNQEIVLGHLMEGIGIALDVRGDRMFVTDLAGSIYSAHLNGSERRPIAMAQGNLSGIAYAEKL